MNAMRHFVVIMPLSVTKLHAERLIVPAAHGPAARLTA